MTEADAALKRQLHVALKEAERLEVMAHAAGDAAVEASAKAAGATWTQALVNKIQGKHAREVRRG